MKEEAKETKPVIKSFEKMEEEINSKEPTKNWEDNESFIYNDTIEKLQAQAYDKAKSIGNSFWGYLCNVTAENKAQIENKHRKEKQEDINKKPTDKPMFGFTFGKW